MDGRRDGFRDQGASGDHKRLGFPSVCASGGGPHIEAESVEGLGNSDEAMLDGRGLLGPRSANMPTEARFELENGLKLLVENMRECKDSAFVLLVDWFA